MLQYDNDDIATFYFVITNTDSCGSMIKAWTDNKDLANYYMKFHNCSRYRLKKITKNIKEIVKIINENNHDEICIANILVSDSSGKNNKKIISLPMTETELRFVREESETVLSSKVNYGYLNSVIPFLKDKYKDSLVDIFLGSMINKAVNNKIDKYNKVIDFDELLILLKSFPDDFG